MQLRTRLEMLNLSHNRLNDIQSVSSLQSLIALNLGEQSSGMSNMVHDTDRWYPAGLKLFSRILLSVDVNSLGELEIGTSMPRLRILRVSGNRLHNLDVGAMLNLRTLYADNNSLANLVKVDRLTKLENLSLRNQSGG
jgi:Leucine-rich repeat (LRR) protein